MENNYFVSRQDKLDGQKKIIESFVMYLLSITKAMNDGEYNFKMINDICKMIQDYYSKNNDEDEEEDEEEEDTSSELGNMISDDEKVKIQNMSEKKLATESSDNMESSDNKESSDEKESSDNDKEASDQKPPQLQMVSQKKNMNVDLFEQFLNSENYTKSILAPTNYDIQNNIKNFIDNSYKY